MDHDPTITAPAHVVAPPNAPAPAQVGDKNIAPTTTAAEDATKVGQRRVNLIWESMQAVIAAAVVGVALYVAGRLALVVLSPEATDKQSAIGSTAFMLIANLVSLIIGFYFGRTNHVKTGGVGPRETGR